MAWSYPRKELHCTTLYYASTVYSCDSKYPTCAKLPRKKPFSRRTQLSWGLMLEPWRPSQLNALRGPLDPLSCMKCSLLSLGHTSMPYFSICPNLLLLQKSDTTCINAQKQKAEFDIYIYNIKYIYIDRYIDNYLYIYTLFFWLVMICQYWKLKNQGNANQIARRLSQLKVIFSKR